MNKYSQGYGWDNEGDIIAEDGKPLQISGSKFLLNVIMFHLLTEPGTYKPAPNAGLGLLQMVGVPNTENIHALIKKEINSYFRQLSSIKPYRVIAKVTPTDKHAVDITLSITGPDLEEEAHLLIDVEKGRIIDSMDFVEEAETVVSTTETETADEVNSYLARLSNKD